MSPKYLAIEGGHETLDSYWNEIFNDNLKEDHIKYFIPYLRSNRGV